MVSLRNNGHAECLIKLLDQGTLESMVVNMLNLTGRSYSAGKHNLHFSTRILKHVRILTPDTNSEARANSDDFVRIPTQASPKEWPPLSN